MRMITYTDGTEIQKCTNEADLSNLGLNFMKNEWRLEVNIVKYRENFDVLYDCWIAPCVDFMELNEQDAGKLFDETAEEAECKAFLEKFEDYLLDAEIINSEKYREFNERCDEIDRLMNKAKLGLRLRVKCVCILLGAIRPGQVFDEGPNWYLAFVDKESDDMIPIRQDSVFVLDYSSAVERLYPRMLKNTKDCPLSFRVLFQESEYTINLPSKGFLRAVFADLEGKRLLSIKGNISVGTEGNALIQKLHNGIPILQVLYKGNLHPVDYGGGLLQDATSNKGAEMVLTDNRLYDTYTEETLDATELPIRLYSTGSRYARQYEDGHLDSDLLFSTDQRANYAIAVAEESNPGAALLIRDRKQAWRFNGSRAAAISDMAFVEAMLARFSYPQYCEYVRTDFGFIAVNQRGDVKYGKT